MFTTLLRSISWSRISHGPCQRTPGVQRANRKLLSGSHFVEPGAEYRADRFRSRLEVGPIAQLASDLANAHAPDCDRDNPAIELVVPPARIWQSAAGRSSTGARSRLMPSMADR